MKINDHDKVGEIPIYARREPASVFFTFASWKWALAYNDLFLCLPIDL